MTHVAVFVTFRAVVFVVAMKLEMFFQHELFGRPEHTKRASETPNLDVGSGINSIKMLIFVVTNKLIKLRVL